MAVAVSIKTVGIGTLAARLREMGKKVPKSAGVTLYKFAGLVITRAKQVYVPVAPDGGTLRGSGAVGKIMRSGNQVSVTMGFGDGPSAPYALAVHEHLSKHSPRSWKKHGQDIKWNVAGTGPKYLEKPFLELTTGGNLEQGLADDLGIEWNKS